MENKVKKIRKLILVRVLLAPAIILLLVCGTLVYYFTVFSSNQVKNELVRIATDHRRLIDQFFDDKISTLIFISSAYDIKQLSDKAFLVSLFSKLQIGSKAFFDIGVIDEKGDHLAYAGPYDLAGKNYAQAEWFKEVQSKGLYISDEFLGYRNIPHFIIAVRREAGGRTWYLRATIDTYYFNDLVENIRTGKTGEAYVVNRKGILQTQRRSGGRLMELDPYFDDYQVDAGKITSFSAGGRFKRQYLYAAGPLNHTDWIMVVRQETYDAYEPLIFSAFVSIILIIGGGAVVVIMGYILASGMADQLNLANMEKSQMKTQLIIAGKLAEVGEMSTGIAHEINNPLQVMKSELSMIKEVSSELRDNMAERDRENFLLLTDSADQIGIQIERCAKITQGLLRFARKIDSTVQPVTLQKFMPEVVAMVEQRAQVENIRIVQEFDPDIPQITSDPNQLQQVFLNLFNNSIYALQEKESGEIRVKISRDREWIVITVTDNGCGFSPENMEKAFLPFFTTKPVGEGTGLGLSTVYGIIKGLGGDIALSSELNVGSIFTIRLPLRAPEEK